MQRRHFFGTLLLLSLRKSVTLAGLETKGGRVLGQSRAEKCLSEQSTEKIPYIPQGSSLLEDPPPADIPDRCRESTSLGDHFLISEL